MRRAILIAGPTASGKSALAIKVAHLLDELRPHWNDGPAAEIINADSMQVYSVLKVLTARPDPSEMAGIVHHLYGHVHPGEPYSVARWLEEAKGVFEKATSRGRIAIFVGGTGLYFKALVEGLSQIPPVDGEIRADLRARADGDYKALRKRLRELDPAGYQAIDEGDRQRTVRALEVILSSGKPLTWWQDQKTAAPLFASDEFLGVVLEPDRTDLRVKIARRFSQMVDQGALEEVRELLTLELSPKSPAMKAIGVRELAKLLDGELREEEALEKAVIATGQYAKRQATWFRNQSNATWIRATEHEFAINDIKKWLRPRKII